ncbi:MAG: glycosyltransferase family 2 protein [Chitinophagaceae bacterium]
MDFSIIIPTANRPDLLEKCIEEILDQVNQYKESVEVIVSDDSVSESINENLRLQYPSIKWMNGPHSGPAANRNHATTNAKGDWLLFIDDDCIPTSGWFEAYLNAIQESEHTVVFEGKTVALGERTSFAQVAPVNENGGNLWSCNFLIKNDFYKELNGFDESFPYPAMEDVDLCIRIKKNKQILFVSDAVVYHPWRTMKPFSMFQKHWRSHIILAKKHQYYRSISYRWSRVKIFLGQGVRDLIVLKNYSFRGKSVYIENVLLNFLLIFL